MALSGRELWKILSTASPRSGFSKAPGHKHERPAAALVTGTLADPRRASPGSGRKSHGRLRRLESPAGARGGRGYSDSV